MPLPAWAVAAVLLGTIQILVGSAATWVRSPSAGGNTAIPDAVFVFIALVNAGVAVLLFLGGRRDSRALYLAAAFIFGGSAFSLRPLAHTADALPSLGLAVGALGAIPVETLFPYFIWRFAVEFPQVTRYGRQLRYVSGMTRLSLLVGVALMLVALTRFILSGHTLADSGIPWLDAFDREGRVYWPVLLGLAVAALGASLAKIRYAKVEERRRAAWLVVGLAVGLAPVIVANLLAWLVPSFAAWVRQPGSLRLVGLFTYPAIIASPFIIAYSVLVEHALDVRLVIRKALQYALARYSVATLVAIPFGVLLVFLYANRGQTLAVLFSGWRAIALLSATVVGAALLARRRSMAHAVDRLFFREQYDARQILADLVRASQGARDVKALGETLIREINRALHPRAACLLIRDPTAQAFVTAAGHARPLRVTSTLLERLSKSGRSFVVGWERAQDPIYSLPADDVEWLGDGGFRLLVPILSTTGGMAGFLGLAEKLSELPYSTEDRELLEGIAMSAALTIENQALRSGMEQPVGTPQEFASECLQCGKVSAPTHTTCTSCGSLMAPAPVPLVVAGKYEVMERIGSGGMGVVYRARDLALDRDAAIKTLPWVSPQHAQRLRREARAMASLSHPNLALIHAVESWHGTPLLILEYLSGGTLSDRLRRGPLPLPEAVALGLVLTSVADYIHNRGILHRDIKPSNIGFTDANQPKLLDFGVAHLLQAARTPRPRVVPPPEAAPRSWDEGNIPWEQASSTITVAGEVVGTPLYLSPEALGRATPGPDFDLWSICMVLYEAIAGSNPLVDENPAVVFRRIAECDIPDIRSFAPDLPAAAADFFAQALAKDLRSRPATAGELRHRLAGIPVT